MSGIINWIKQMDLHTMLSILEAIIIVIIFKVFSSLLSIIVLKIFHIGKSKEDIKQTAYFKTLKKFFPILGLYIALMGLGLEKNVFDIITKIFKIITIIIVTNGIALFIETNKKVIEILNEKAKIESNNKMKEFIIKSAKTLIYIIAGFIIIRELGYDLSGLVAGLGLRKCCCSTCSTGFSKKYSSWCNYIYG